jgi:hypothetical protein
MSRKANNSKNTAIVLTITLISAVIMTILVSCLTQPNFIANSDAIIDDPKQSSLSTNTLVDNQTDTMNVTNLQNNYSSTNVITVPIFADTVNSTTYEQSDPNQFFSSILYDTIQGQSVGSDTTLQKSVTDNDQTNTLNGTNLYNDYSSIPASINSPSSGALKFESYTYGGDSVLQSDPDRFFFSFPNNTNQGQIAGSDAITLDTYSIQKLDFDAVFNAPKISAVGFDEMVIFAASNTITYKGTEFGIRMDLKDGFIYSYIQEPNGDYGDVNFQMLRLTPNDGIIHHYTLIALGSGVSFWVDGRDYGFLSFPSYTDYSNLTFSVCAVVHRFTDYWDSSGDTMMTANFSLNQN